jgi:hypothetical protein
MDKAIKSCEQALMGIRTGISLFEFPRTAQAFLVHIADQTFPAA